MKSIYFYSIFINRKNGDAQVEIEEYENLKKIISKHLKEPIDPSVEIRKMREKQYLI